MCGICGFLGFQNESREAILEQMMNKIIHRGPDSDGKYINDDVAFGFRRLSIIDLENGSQPMVNEDGSIVIIFNGEIYNHKLLREELAAKGHIFANNADTQVLLHGYEEWGLELPTKLRGMFGFAIWDSNTKTFFAARDFFGIKPFYYTECADGFIFGSEIKSILEHPGYQKEVNVEALESYLSFQYSALPETFFKGIYKLPPAHYMVIQDGEKKIVRYWEPKFEEQDCTEEEAIEKIDNIMQDSIRAHMISDVEVGSFLSSGVDSSYVAACFHGDKTFTVGFDYDKYNEIEFAKSLSEEVGIQNYHKLITTQEYWDILPTVQYQMDEPLADPAAVALYFVSQIASEHVKVVLSGEGADELFGGYNIYKEPLDLAGIQRLPRFLRKAMAAVVSALPFSFKGKNYLIRASKTVEERFIGNANMFSVKERNQVLKHAPQLCTPQDITKPFYDKVSNKDDITKMQYVDIHTWLIGDILLKADRMSMAHSLELRVPFMDRYVCEVATSLPTRLRTNRENTKYAMRKAALRHIPEKTASRKKLGFPVPIRIWLREDAYYEKIKEAFTSPAAEKYFNTDYLLKLLETHRAGKKDYSRKIWTVYMFLVWHKQYFE